MSGLGFLGSLALHAEPGPAPQRAPQIPVDALTLCFD